MSTTVSHCSVPLISCLALSGRGVSFLQSPTLSRKSRVALNDDNGKCKGWRASTLHGSRPYVPDGLTPEEYSQIKKKEREKMAKMDFGAFGPRFRKDVRPGGDWFLMSSLWTTGFQTNASSPDALPPDGPVARLWSLIRRYGLSLFLSRMLLEIMFATAAMVRTSSSLQTMPLVAIGESLQFLIARTYASLLWKSQCLKLAMACAFTVPAHKFINYVNRRWLWSPARTFITAVVAALLSHVMFGMFLLE
ncbi:hypothetical protein MHU86_21274 [Fragilaria crotonensis]|nr:hypothetical protein MHU86_21274 [Fragilaria crotonensis]